MLADGMGKLLTLTQKLQLKLIEHGSNSRMCVVYDWEEFSAVARHKLTHIHQYSYANYPVIK